LAGDLAELAAEAGYDLGPLVDRFAAHALDAEEQLLEDYSALFLVPPVPVPLNAGLYLDGGLLGRGTQAMLQRYGEAGLAPDERFRDLPDHISMQLEYVAVMFARAAEGDPSCAARANEFLAQFVLGWIPAFRQALQASAQRIPAARAYGALAAILEAAARHESLLPSGSA
jgi:TorA maturation chaperone TorD